jgi:hypothetical protein
MMAAKTELVTVTPLIPPLIALVRDGAAAATSPACAPLPNDLPRTGNVYAKTYAMHALLAMSRTPEGCRTLVLDDLKPVTIVVNVVRTAPYTPLLQVRRLPLAVRQDVLLTLACDCRGWQAALQWLVVSFGTIRALKVDLNSLQEKAFIRILVHMLQPRKGTKGDRHPPAVRSRAPCAKRIATRIVTAAFMRQVLAEVGRLVTHLMAEENSRKLMIEELDIVRTLMSIIEDHANYSQQLEVFAKCLANAFIHGKSDHSMFSLQRQGTGAVADQAEEYAVALARTISVVAATNRVRVVLYLLTVLRQICRTTLAEKNAEKEMVQAVDEHGQPAYDDYGQPEMVDTRLSLMYRKDARRRFSILKMLSTTNVAFDRVLTTIQQSTRAWATEATAQHSRTMAARAEAEPAAAADGEEQPAAPAPPSDARPSGGDGSDTVKAVQEIVEWFKRFISDAPGPKGAWEYDRWYQRMKENEAAAARRRAGGIDESENE